MKNVLLTIKDHGWPARPQKLENTRRRFLSVCGGVGENTFTSFWQLKQTFDQKGTKLANRKVVVDTEATYFFDDTGFSVFIVSVRHLFRTL